MARIPERVIDEVRFRNDIVEVIGSYITLKRSGGGTFKACCPFHKEKTPSFNVNPQRQIFKCFGCGVGGNVFKFLQLYEGLDFLTAVKTLADRANIPIEFDSGDSVGREKRQTLYKIHSELAAFYRRCLLQAPGAETARTYIEERQLAGEIGETFMIGYAPDRWDVTLTWARKYGYDADVLVEAGLLVPTDRGTSRYYDRFRDRIMFPISDGQGRVIGFSGRLLQKEVKAAKYVNSPETPIFHKGRILYAQDKARRHIVSADAREAIICEGQIDVIRCHQSGFQTAVACQGTAFTTDHAGILKRYADGVVIVFDSDGAGQDAAIKAAVIFMDAGLVARVASLPDGEDPDTFLLNKGQDAFQGVLDDATSAVRFQLRTLAARERDPRSVGSIDRLAKAALDTIAHSPNAVQRARLLEEASEELDVPVEALRQDLDAVVKKQDARKAQQATYGKRNISYQPAPTAASIPPTPGAAPTTPPAFDYDIVDDEEYDIDEFVDTPRHHPTSPPRATDAKALLDERSLCEQLALAAEADPARTLAYAYVPGEVVTDKTCRDFLALAREAGKTATPLADALAASGNAELRTFGEACLRAPQRVIGNEFTAMDSVQSIILSIWRRYLRRQYDALIQGAHDDAERSQLNLDISHLKRWNGETRARLETQRELIRERENEA